LVGLSRIVLLPGFAIRYANGTPANRSADVFAVPAADALTVNCAAGPTSLSPLQNPVPE
jgi:hypothetical protein